MSTESLRRHLAVSCAVLCLLMAVAQSATGESEARSRIQAGEQAFARGEFQRALEAFEAALEADGRPALLYNIAMCHWELDQIPQAVNTFRRYLRVDASNIQASDRQEIDGLLTEMATGFGDAVFTGIPEGAALFIDGVQVGIAPLPEPLAVAPGDHVFTVRSPRADEEVLATTTATVVADDRLTVELELPSPAHAEPEPASEALPPLVSQHDVDRRQPWWFWAGVGVASATAVAAIVTGALTLEARSTYVDSGQLDIDAYDRGQSLALTTDVLIGIAASAAVVVVISLIVHGIRRRRAASESRSQNQMERAQTTSSSCPTDSMTPRGGLSSSDRMVEPRFRAGRWHPLS